MGLLTFSVKSIFKAVPF